ncbi:MAG: methyltransferase domain-containing protein, partial [Acidobacteriaceae bacterium]
MPFEEGSFDFLVCRAAFKNFTDPAGALREMRRVLKPGRKGVIIDLRRDVSMREITRYVDGLHLNPVSRLMTLLTFRFMLLRRAYTREQFEAMLKQVPFAETRIDLNPIGMEIWFER